MIPTLLNSLLATFLLSSASTSPIADFYVDVANANCATGTGALGSPVCSIGDAIALASSGDTIRIAPGTYFENVVISDDVELLGEAGASVTIVDGSAAGSVVTVPAQVTAVINGLTLTNGQATTGGGVNVAGAITLRNSTVSMNSASMGGGIGTDATGGAVIEIDACTISQNYSMIGGGIHSAGSQVSISASTLADNGGFTSGSSGAGINLTGGSNLVLISSTVCGNDSEFGGGLRSFDSDFELTNSTFSANRANRGGGIYSSGSGYGQITSCTIASNWSLGYCRAAVEVRSGSYVGMSSTIVGLNGGSAFCVTGRDLRGGVILQEYNLIGDAPFFPGFGINGNLVGGGGGQTLNPDLEQLQFNGGPTRTRKIRAGSPAIDAGNPANFAQFDQRGVARPNGGAPDIGAYEADAIPVNHGDVNTCNTGLSYLKPATTSESHDFGRSVALSGDTLVVGAPRSTNSVSPGDVHVFVRSGLTWTLEASFTGSNTEDNDLFGRSVALSGDTLIVGAPEERSNATGANGDESDNSLSGAGAAYVFVRNGSTWTQEAYLKASNTKIDQAFGYSVCVSGDIIGVGARSERSNATGVNGDQSDNSLQFAGAAYAFARVGSLWTQQAYLKAPVAAAFTQFGASIAVSGETIVVGAPDSSDLQNFSGAADVFVRTGTVWSAEAHLKASNPGAGDHFGDAVSISGESLVVGASREDSAATGVDGDESSNGAPGSGAAYVFARSGTAWMQEAYLKASASRDNNSFGLAVSLSGDKLVVGARNEDSPSTGVNASDLGFDAPDSGAAYMFLRQGSSWSQRMYLKASNTDPEDHFGSSVAISEGLIAVGATREDSNASGVDSNASNNSLENAGAVYTFTMGSLEPNVGIFRCLGDGGNQQGCTNCPCGNNAVPGTRGGCTNSAGSSACLEASGSLSVSLPPMINDDLRFGLSGLPPLKFSILTSGAALSPTNPANPCNGSMSGTQAAAFDGLRCAAVNIRRHGGRPADLNGTVGMTNNPWGGEGAPPVGIAQFGSGFAAGQTRFFQAIYREEVLLGCMRGLSTSQAVELIFTP